MLLTVDVLEVDVLVVDVLELDVLGARPFFLAKYFMYKFAFPLNMVISFFKLSKFFLYFVEIKKNLLSFLQLLST